MRVYFEVFGEDQVSYDLLRFADRSMDVRPALLQIAADVREKTEERFDTEGPGWAPLAESTIRAKGHDQILYATGALRDSLTRLGAGHVEIATDDSLLMASEVTVNGYNLGQLHQQGTATMPARPIVDFSVADHAGFVRTLQRYIVEGSLIGALL